MSNLLSKHAKSFLTTRTAASGTQSSFGLLDEPTYLVFEPIFTFEALSGLFADETYTNSALAHLKRIGEYERYKTLKRAIENLKQLVDESPWSFLSVTGFQDAIVRKLDEPTIEEGMLEFEMRESLDMRVSKIFLSILDVIYDRERLVEVIPRNLQEFSVSLLLHELRIFRGTSSIAKEWLGQDDTSPASDLLKVNHILLHFGKCKLLTSTGKALFDKYSNSDITEAGFNVDIQFMTCARTQNFNDLAGAVSQGSTLSSGNIRRFADGTTMRVPKGESFEQAASRPEFKKYMGQTSGFANDLVSQTNVDFKSKSIFEDNKFGINKRDTFNKWFGDSYKSMEALTNPGKSIIDAIAQLSSLALNRRRSINIFRGE